LANIHAETARTTVADPGLHQIGPSLKSWRTKRNLTLDGLSELTGISASTISRLESGKRAPNLELVIPLARALRISLDDLVPQAIPDPRVKRVTRRTDEVTFEQLSPDASPTNVAKMTYPPPRPGEVPDPRVHDGYDWLYVLSGRIRLVLGEHDIVMGEGEAAEFDTRTPHWMGSAGPGAAEILTIFSEQGKRIHLRARPGGTRAGADARSAAR
jgi:transcriptional regulator with XRE-family HTH domain